VLACAKSDSLGILVVLCNECSIRFQSKSPSSAT
jgi:hypothetical protein